LIAKAPILETDFSELRREWDKALQRSKALRGASADRRER
jgi:hypothetical protein